ncbi:P34-Arc-domain-containing protein [Trichoderma longibrachiatum ATCC 18648]|uniref:Probable endonuclease LCL3 n=1 Tax=Trichoderma longibrachiatum ATCC 18648 TaxID=983965 RepID=A0A2T4CIN0_TRILO|nr:P34-Arc-domain-containing protein [Trichoderma longibrachiatum ATCC 18648]
MLLLDYQNALIQSVLTERFSGAPPVHIDQTVSDFDGVTFHISTPEVKTKILLSIQIRCFKDLAKYGAEQVLQREYGQYVVPVEVGYDFSVLVDLENLPESKEERDALAMQFALLKRHAMAAPFEQAYEEHYKLKEEASKFSSEDAPKGVMEGGEVKAIHYREEEAIYVKASHDRVTVIFSTIFREETDRVYGKVFIQEFVDARRRAIQNAPQVLFRNDPPLELQGVPGVQDTGSGEIGYVTFVLFPRHLTPARMPVVISHIQTFRDNFHYHIKASKAYIHSRMRKRTADFLQVLRRARPDNEERERKTASGRTFKRHSTQSPPKADLRVATTMVWPFGGSEPSKRAPEDDQPQKKRPISWPDTLSSNAEDAGPLAAAKAWAPMVGFSLVGLAALQLYANYLRRIPGAAYVRPNFFRNRSLFGRVTSVGDGDNFHLFHTPGGRAVGWGWLRKVPETRKELKGRTIPIRIAAIDAPEGAHFGKPAQPYAAEALQWLRNYILHRNVRAYIYKTDQYERIVATVYVRRFLLRKNVGLEMIKAGLATVYEAKSGGEYGGLEERYKAAEAKARRKRRGMWAGDPKAFESPREYKTRWAAQQDKTQ